jgi:hypothetical protein
MELSAMTDTEREINLAAEVFSPRYDYPRGCIDVGGAQVYAWLQDGTLVVAVHLEDVAEGAFRQYGADACVPVQVTVSGETVYYAGDTP